MKSFVAISGSIFALLLVAHGARFAAEGASVLGEPIFILTTVASAAMTLWGAALVVRRRDRP